MKWFWQKKEVVVPIGLKVVEVKDIYEWDVTYKCRRCGKIFVGYEVYDDDRKSAEATIQHKCSDITYGIADIQGFENKHKSGDVEINRP